MMQTDEKMLPIGKFELSESKTYRDTNCAVTLLSNREMSLAEASGLVVLKGSLELFYKSRDGEDITHIATLNEGDYLLPCAPGSAADAFTVKAQPDTSCLRIECGEDAEEIWSSLASLSEDTLKSEHEKLSLRITGGAAERKEALKRAVSTLANVPFCSGKSFLKDITRSNLVGRKSCIMLAVHQTLGLKTHNVEIREDLSMEEVLHFTSLQYRSVELGENWWKKRANTPYLVNFTDESGVKRPGVLLPCPCVSGFRLYDGEKLTEKRISKADSSRVENEAYKIYRQLPDGEITLRKLLNFAISGSTAQILYVLFLSIMCGALGLLIPEMTGEILSSLIPDSDYEQLALFFVLLTSLALGTALFTAVQHLLLLRSEGLMSNDLEAAIWDKLLKVQPGFFREYSSGNLNSRISSLGVLWESARPSFNTLMTSSAFALFYLCQCLWYDWELALIAFVLLSLLTVVIIVTGLKIIKHQQTVLEITNRVNSNLVQFISGLSKLKVAAAEEHVFSIWAADFAAQRDCMVKIQKLQRFIGFCSTALPVFITGALFYYVVNYVMYQDEIVSVYRTSDFLKFWSAYTLLLSGVVSISASVISIASTLPSLKAILPILNAVPEQKLSSLVTPRLSGDIQIRGLGFRYDEQSPYIISNLDLHIKSGEFLAIVGKSGCGKSTLIRLLLNFEQPCEGGIYFDGKSYAEMNVKNVRNQIGTVLQSGGLIAGDILSNITCSRNISFEDACTAAEKAGLKDDIDAMPMGMNTSVGEGSGTLSGGQRQRLIIARAIAGKPKILFFDEATSALDNKTQASVMKSIAELDATRVVVAQRLSTIQSADRIILLENGSIAEEGSYEELMAKNGKFYELCQRQMF